MMVQKIPKEIEALFDASWYLNEYTDVAASGIDPKSHFLNHGWSENRWPCFFEAIKLDQQLWTLESPSKTVHELETLLTSKSQLESGLAFWFLSRWFGSLGNWPQVKPYIQKLLENKLALMLIRHEGPFLLAFSCFYELEDLQSAKKLLESAEWQESHNKRLANSMLVEGEKVIDVINNIYLEEKLEGLLRSPQPLFNEITVKYNNTPKSFWFKPLVSVIVPCFNAGTTLAVALKSLLNQSYEKLEVIVVDDASIENTEAEMRKAVGSDSRFKLIRLEQNGGTYNARNIGLRYARGSFITTHDADDWSHPRKIELQALALKKNRQAKASISHWVRCDEYLKFACWRMEDGWIHRNISSLMFRRDVHKKLGYWDNVAVNADTEYLERIIKQYGKQSIVDVLPSVPLAFGRKTETSLTQSSFTHLRTQYKGVRKEYMLAARRWHNNSSDLSMAFNKERKFVAPPYICRGNHGLRVKNAAYYLLENNGFDSEFYLQKNRDVELAGVEPIKHFSEFGLLEGRDPNALLSLSGYAFLKSKSYYFALADWTVESSVSELPVSVEGKRHAKSNNHNILMVAHQVAEHLFGAERSFLDCVKMLDTLNFNIFLILPEAKNIPYVDELANYAIKIFFVPLCWWNGNRKPIEPSIKLIGALIEKYNIDYLYGNTITLWEPFLAAKEKNITSVMHIREIPEHDNDLCELLKAKPTEIKRHVASLATHYIANSVATHDAYQYACKSKIVPNVVNIPVLSDKQFDGTDIEVVIVSSNIEKKGIRDFFKVAARCYEKSRAIKFTIYGPNTALLQELLGSYSLKNLTYGGFAEALSDVYEKAHIVLSLSHFAESFGRTVLEGMAHRCVVIAYLQEALSELIDKNSGVIVDAYSIEQVVNEIITLEKNKEKLKKLGNNAALKVAHAYRAESVAPRLMAAILNK